MTTYTISIGTLSVTVRSEGAHDKGQKEVALQINWCTLYQAREAAKAFALARLLYLLEKYEAYQTEKHKEFLAEWPPHSLFCEERCCQKSINTYWHRLKKDIVWGRDGHII